MKILTSILLAIIVNLISSPLDVYAETIAENKSTADIATASPIPPFAGQIELLEIAFKDSEQDYFIFEVNSTEQKINLKGLQFYDDSNFKTIEENFWIQSGDQIRLTFNSPSPDSPQNKELFTEKKGLTSTTEQILIHHGPENLAFFCWVKSPIAKSEISDFNKIHPPALWDEADIESCFPSETVKNNQILHKVGNENNAGSWSVITDPLNTSSATDSSNNQSETPTTKKTSSTDLQSLIDSAANNQSTIPLQITEIYPAPIGTDDHEWVEILNEGNTDINLQNWIIDDSEGGSKPKQLNALIAKPGIPLIINMKPYKINLNNDQDSVRLFEPDGTSVTEQDYDGAKKGYSYSLLIVDEEELWEWTQFPSPGQLNPVLSTITGTLIVPAQFEDNYFFGLETADTEKYLITFSEDLIKAPLAKEIFQVGTAGTFTGQISTAPANENDYVYIMELSGYELNPSGSTPFNWPPLLIIIAIPLLALGGYLLIKNQKNLIPATTDNF